jgi:agmatine deiminase
MLSRREFHSGLGALTALGALPVKPAKAARQKLSASIDIWDIPTDDLWSRDSGPVLVKDNAGKCAITHLNFNGWGNKQTHHNDGQIARSLAERLRLPLLDNSLVGKVGGGIHCATMQQPVV